MPDFPPVYEDLLVWEFLDLFAASYGMPRDRRPLEVGRHLEMVGLTEKRDAMVGRAVAGDAAAADAGQDPDPRARGCSCSTSRPAASTPRAGST